VWDKSFILTTELSSYKAIDTPEDAEKLHTRRSLCIARMARKVAD